LAKIATDLNYGAECSAGGVRVLAWWPKSNREWRRFGFVLAYLVVFFSVMVFTFHFADSGGKP
jgi:hypothetical protein